MDFFTRADLRMLLPERAGPCVSLFMGSHRGGAEQDPTRFRKLLGRAEEKLVATGLRGPEARDFLTPLHFLLNDETFWANQCDGLAVFRAREFLSIYRLPRSFMDQIDVGKTFHVVPLLPLLQGDGRFYILALSQNGVRLLQGTRDTVSPVDLRSVPRNLAEAMMTHDRDNVLTFHTRPTSGGTWGAIFGGHGVGIDDKKDDLLRYFRQVDRGLQEVLREERSPLVLAAVDYFHAIYRRANTYAHLLEGGIDGSPDRLGEKELHARAWALVEPHFAESRGRALSVYRQALSAGRATSDVRRAVPAACRGQVETLFITLGSHLWGTVDLATNATEVHEPPRTTDVDLLNVAAIETLRHGNTVYVLRPEEMPDGAVVAATYHLPLAKHSKRA